MLLANDEKNAGKPNVTGILLILFKNSFFSFLNESE